MILLAFILGPLGFIAIVLLAAGWFASGLCRTVAQADRDAQERRAQETRELDEWYRLPLCESRMHGSVR